MYDELADLPEATSLSREDSSCLSDGWCISITGKPCQSLRIYASEPEDDIGNLFGKRSEEEDREDRDPAEGVPASPQVEAELPVAGVVPPEGSVQGAEQQPTLDIPEKPTTIQNIGDTSPPVQLPEKEPSAENTTVNLQVLDDKLIEPVKNNQDQEVTQKSKDTVNAFGQKDRGSKPPDGTVIYIGCKRSGRRSKHRSEAARAPSPFCDEKNCQTSHPSILKRRPTGQRHQETSTDAMDVYPVKDTAATAPPVALTSDKMLQTSDDRLCFFRCGRDSASNTEQTEVADSFANTSNTESTKVQTTSEKTWSGPEENRCWYCSKEQRCRSRMVRRNMSFSSMETSPRTLASYPSDTRVREESPRGRYRYADTSGERVGYVRVPPGEGSKPVRRFVEPRPRPKQTYPRVVPCDGRCRRSDCAEAQGTYRQLSFRPPPPPIPQDSSSSEEETGLDEDDDDDVDGFTSDGSRRHQDLPYQNNEEYLELVHELEETLQNRNRNRVKRAMKEFENKSRYNKPLEQPIINYEEASESEEPIIRRISELNEKRIGRCRGDCCGCRKGERTKPKRSLPKPKKVQREQARWQMDNKSGEWFKVTENDPPKVRRINELPCGCACSCGK